MNKPFLSLLARLNLPEDTSADDLLVHAKNKLKSTPSDPELLYSIAELQRHLGETQDASDTYNETVKLTNDRTKKRAEVLQQRLANRQKQLKRKLAFLIIIPITIILLVTGFGWKALTTPKPLPADSDPKNFSFTQWLAKQQMTQIMTTLQNQNPEISFDFNSTSANAMSPMEFMQSLMKPDALAQLRREQQDKDSNNNDDGKPSFQCSREPAIQCAAGDIPTATGKARTEVVLLMEAYRTVIESEKDCAKLEQSIHTIGEQLNWRKSEKHLKANLEYSTVECFFRKKNAEKTLEHLQKLQCVSDDSNINSVFWFKTAIYHQTGDKAKTRQSYECFKEATDHLSKNDHSPTYVAARHRESGALAWLYFNDLVTATAELKKGQAVLRNVEEKTPTMLKVIAEIDLDLMETYVTANTDFDTFQELLEQVNSSGLLTDGYKQIKDTLAAIYFLQNDNNESALSSLNNLTSRFKLMPEFICGWDWRGFERGLKESTFDDNVKEQALALVDISNCYTPQTMKQRIAKTNKVIHWLKSR